jgi:hypothetical protein
MPTMSQPLAYWVQNAALDTLTTNFGSRLQCLPHDHKVFMLKCLVHQYSAAKPMSDLIDQLDPDALIPERVCDAIVSLDGLPSSEVLNLMEAIVPQLESEVMEANLTQRRSAS